MLKIYTYNAGKGDCIRLHFGDNHNIFIDTGVTRFGLKFKSICESILSSTGTLDLLILTHVDDDHIGGILSLLRLGWRCPFREVRMNYIGETGTTDTQLSTRQNMEVVRLLRQQNVKISSMLAKDEIDIIGARITTVSPTNIVQGISRYNSMLSCRKDYGLPLVQLAVQPIQRKDTSINNKNSIVFVFEYEGKRLLFTGDAWAEDIIDGLGVGEHYFDLVKLPHHGAIGNISEEFKKQISCRKFLICTDGLMHPDKQTIAKLVAWYGNIDIYSPSDWWSNGFFVRTDSGDGINLMHKEGLVIGWEMQD